MKRCLLVGINRYPGGNQLNGCVNDTKLVYKICKDIYKFDQFKILTDEEGTKKKIIKELQWLVRGVNPGDTLLFHFSGHGSQVPVNDRTASFEPDGLDEIICNIDLDWDRPIRDDDLGDMFERLPKGVKTTVILDSCHSGHGLKNPMPNGYKNRYLYPPPSKMLRHGHIELNDDLSYLTSRDAVNPVARTKPFLVTKLNPGDAVLISGCKDNQYSADGDFNSIYHGALTFYLAQTLKEHNWKIGYADLVTLLNEKMDQNNFEQDPQLEGSENATSGNFLGGPA
jgi:metacaspase-1